MATCVEPFEAAEHRDPTPQVPVWKRIDIDAHATGLISISISKLTWPCRFCSARFLFSIPMPRNFPAALSAVCTQPACAAGASVAQSGRARLPRERQVATRSTRKTSIALFDSKSRCVTFGNWWPAKIPRQPKPSHYFLPGNKYKVKFRGRDQRSRPEA